MDNYVWREALDDILNDVLNEFLAPQLAEDLIRIINERIDNECMEDDDEDE